MLALLVGGACAEEMLATPSTAEARSIPFLTGSTLAVSHAPIRPTLTDVVTITAQTSPFEPIDTITITVNGHDVKTCAGFRCIYSSPFSAGDHTYGATAVGSAGYVLTSALDTFTVTDRPIGGGAAAPSSPHWRHMRFGGVDYRIIVGRYGLTSATASEEWDWVAGHTDYSINGDEAEYLIRNPTFRIFRYDTFWFTPVANAGEIENCLQANGYSVENAYLHKAGGPKSLSNRVTHQQFKGRDYWYWNVGDPGFRTCRDQRTQNRVAQGAVGLFFDSHSRNVVRKYALAQPLLEYADAAAYWTDHESLLALQRALVPSGYVLLNQSTYFNKPDEMTLAQVAGGTMTEFVNASHRDPHWEAVDQLTAAGVHVDYSGQATDHFASVNHGENPGNYASVRERRMMWNYASYLMVVVPADMDRVVFNDYIDAWNHPHSTAWLNAYTYDIGLATGGRSVIQSGTDPAGQRYAVYAREFENAIVLIRKQEGRTPRGSYDYSDRAAVSVTLPAGNWRILLSNGALGNPVTNLQLRAGEAVIVVS